MKAAYRNPSREKIKDGKKALSFYEDPRSLLSEVGGIMFPFLHIFPKLESYTYTHTPPLPPTEKFLKHNYDLRPLSHCIDDVVDTLLLLS